MSLLRRLDLRYRALRRSVIWILLARQRRWVKAMIWLSVASFVVNLGTAGAIRDIVDRAIIEKSDYIETYTSKLFGLALASLVLGFAQRQVIARLGYHLEYDLRLWLYSRLQSMNPRVLDTLTTGQLVTRAMTDLTVLEIAILLIPGLAVGLSLLLALAVILFIQSPLMAVIAVAGIPVNAYLIHRIRKQLFGLSWLNLNRKAEVTAAIDEPVRGIRVVKVFGREEHERARVRDASRAAYATILTRVRLVAKYDFILRVLPTFLNALLILAAGRIIANTLRLPSWMTGGDFTIGKLLIFLLFSSIFTGFAASFDEIASGWQLAKTGAGRIFELIRLAPADERPNARPLPPPGRGIAFDGVTVHINGGVAVRDIDLEVTPGELAVVVGPPGSGKSLLASLATAGVTPTRGSVRLDGEDLSTLDPVAVRTVVHVLTEDPFLFGRTIRENLEMSAVAAGAPSDDDALWAALRAAGAEEIVQQLPGGLNASLGDRGYTLSGGQRQRIALARALVAPARVLILDDALSAVNPSLELEIIGRVRSHAPGTAIIYTTRREGLASIAGRVVELPAPDAQLAPVDAKAALLAMIAGARDKPPTPEIAAAIEACPPERDEPEVDEMAAIESSEIPTVRNVLRPFAGRVTIAAVTLIGFTIVGLVPIGLFKLAIDDFRERQHGVADVVGMVAAGLAFAIAALSYLFKIFAAKVSEGIMYLLRRRTFQRLTRLGIDYYDRELPGRVAARVVHDLDKISAFVDSGVYQVAMALTLLVGTLGVMFVWNATVASVVLVAVPILLFITGVQVPIASRAYMRSRERLGEVIARFQEDIAGRYVIDALGSRRWAMATFATTAGTLRSARRRATTISNAYIEAVQFVTAMATLALLATAGRLHLEGAISVGSVVSLQLYLAAALAPIPLLSNVLQNYLAARASFRTLAQPYEAPILPREVLQPTVCPPLAGDVVLENITFRYPGTDRYVLDNVSLEVPPGRAIALVGPTGAGKSSIAKLVARVYDPDDGVVLADGIDIRSYELTSYRRRLGIVPQDAFCFRGTVRSNITYGRPDAPDAAIAEIIDAIAARTVLDRIPGGLSGLVEEEGHNLTAAQRQFIAIARALIVEPDILVLDEATSSLDPASEEAVLAGLRDLAKTTIFVTHRLPVARHADTVAVVDGGRVVEQGTHAALMKAGSAYAALWALGPDVELDGGRVRTRRRRRTTTT